MDTPEKMAVIGAGPCGLAAAKALEEHAIPYDHFEADDALGGNWRHGVYETINAITSRKTMEFPDYPMPVDYPDFPSREQIFAYLNDYARAFGIDEHIQFNAKVVYVRPVENNAWELTFESGKGVVYKGALVCNGHHWDRRWPDFPGEFTGEFIHSKDYKRPDQFRGKRVLVIGSGNSACDIVSEAARVSAEAHVSQRRSYWMLPKTLFGNPTVELINPWIPVWFQKLMFKAVLKIVFGDYRKYGLPRPDHPLFKKQSVINNEFLYYLKQGRIHPHPNVKRFDGRIVEFIDGARAPFDMVVCATGFNLNFPFLPRDLIKVENNVAKVYGGFFPSEYRNIYLVGWAQYRYGFGPLLTPAMAFLAKMIKLQDEMAHPIGRVLKGLGAKPPETNQFDPHTALRKIRIADKLMWLLPRIENRVVKEPTRPNPPLPPPGEALIRDKPLVVY